MGDTTQDHIQGGSLIADRFGGWPSFHDAEIVALRLDSGQQSDGQSVLELLIHVFDVTMRGGKANFETHTLITLHFVDVADVELVEFGPQNVLFDLGISSADEAKGSRGLHIELPSSNGLSGGFDCAEVRVASVEPFVPGRYSPYYRPDLD